MSFVPPRGLLAVLAVVDIAINTSQRPLSAKSLATRYNLAPRYLEPMLQMLVQVGYPERHSRPAWRLSPGQAAV